MTSVTAKKVRTESVASPYPHRYITLDMLRGIAALAVICAHAGSFFGRNTFAHGYLAVDFFFMLSGFVLMSAYQAKLSLGWSTISFLKLRLVRLYPLYLLGTLLGFSFTILRAFRGRGALGFKEAGIDLLASLFFFPALAGSGADAAGLYPFDSPTWSLFYELLANLFHALFLRRRSKSTLMILAMISAVGLALMVVHTGDMNEGFTRRQLAIGLLRVAFSYTTGMLLFMVLPGWVKHIRWSAAASAMLLLLLLWTPFAPRYFAIYDVLVTTCVFPVLLLLSTAAVPPQRWMIISLALGNASYAVYVLHVPLAEWYEQLWLRTFRHRIEMNAPWGGVIFLALVFTIAIVIDRVYDAPARAFLRRKVRG